MIFRYDDDYPQQCPPPTAIDPTGLNLFRACKEEIMIDEKLNPHNFIPVWETSEREFPPQNECKAKALSFFGEENEVKDKMQDYPNIGNKLIKVTLNSDCGLAKKNRRGSHVSLWDLHTPIITEAIGDDWEEVNHNE